MTNTSSLRNYVLMQNEALEKIVRGKEQRRKDLSELSFKEKIHVLVELQKMVKGVARHSKAADRIIWQI